jgi:DNA-binding transcriptional regulator YdaS (Cro superfamily)
MAKSKLKTNLAVARKELGRLGGQSGFAKLIGVSESWLKKASCGVIPMTSRMAALIQNKSGISAAFLMNGEGDPFVESLKPSDEFLQWMQQSAYSSLPSEIQFAMMEAWTAGKESSVLLNNK